MGVNMRNWIDSAQDRDLESPCECSIDFISHKVSSIYKAMLILLQLLIMYWYIGNLK